MTYLISETSTYFKNPCDVRVADKVYKNINTHISKDMIDNDGRRKLVNFLDGEMSEIVSYVEHNKVVRSEERFMRPQVMRLGDKVYSGVVSKVTIPDKYDLYSIFKPNGDYNNIKVRPNGTVLDINGIKHYAKMRKIKAPFQKLARLIIGK